jgi:hypothetical protein
MKHIFAALLGTAALLMPVDFTEAGCLTCRKSQHCYNCATAHPVLMPGCAGPVAAYHCHPPMLMAATVQDDCGCHAVATACCGMTAGFGGVAHLGAMYGMSHMGGPGGYTGYEGLPNMDGGGVHGRYPYHSYRRPWAHPGPRSTNVSIVW